MPTFEGGREVDRVVFFSDAVFAIAMTLLAVGIRIPDVPKDQIGPAIRQLAGPVAGYFLTFAVIGLYWMAHHRMFRFIRRVDSTFIILNLVLLALIGLMPVPSDLLGRYGSETPVVILYAASVSAVGLLTTVIWLYATRGRRLVDPTLSHQEVVAATARSASAPVVFLASIPVALVSPTAASLMWLLLLVVRRLIYPRLFHDEATGAGPADEVH